MPIQVLPPDLAAKIAAGEVVERPASVVKELVENAIDAGANQIKIEVRDGGRRLISVADNGSGIPADELPLAFTRHATSKLRTLEDLESVSTLGFRGEALASIAAVARLTLVSCPAGISQGDAPTATQIRIDGGRQMALGPAAAPTGTTVTVENLFYNVPARLKFLKAPATEAGHIHRVITSYALAYPEIRFHLRMDQRNSLQTTGSGQLADALLAVLGLENVRNMVEILQAEGTEPESASGIQVSGFVGLPSLHRGQRDQMIHFVNRRWVQDRSLNAAVVQAYHTLQPTGRFPVAVINISMNPADVDVNVHPTKSEVKFREQRVVFAAVQKAVRSTVVDMARPPEIGVGTSHPFSPSTSGPDGPFVPSEKWHQFGFEAQRTLAGDVGTQPPAGPEPLPVLRVVGQIAQAYIIAEGPDGLYLIDQHAAHERVLYEAMQVERSQGQAASQALLQPALIQLTPGQAAILEAEQAVLSEIGFEIEPFGGASYQIRAVPEILVDTDPVIGLGDILAELAEGAVPLARRSDERLMITVCKRAAIKAGKTLSVQEMQTLIRELEQCQSPRTCPHGRPTMLHLSAARLAYEFGRT